MNIKILPYIKQTTETNPVLPQEETVRSSASPVNDTTSFIHALEQAGTAQTAMAIDFIVKQDADTIREAAAFLKESSHPALQKLALDLVGPSVPQQMQATSTSVRPAINNATTSTPVHTPSANTASSVVSRPTTSTKGPQTAPVITEKESSASAKIASSLGCPASLAPYFVEAADKYNLDVNFVVSVAKAESSFNANDTSRSGAMGIMQLMPATAESLGVAHPYDAHENILGGAKLLSEFLEKYNGNKELTLAAYNAGPGNVSKYGGVPPFSETETYIKRVLGFYADASA